MPRLLILGRPHALVASTTSVLFLLACGSVETSEPNWDELGAPPRSANPFDVSLNQGPPIDPSFKPERPPIDFIRSALTRDGEVLVIDGDSRFVTRTGNMFGITAANETAIVEAVLAEYPDVFDTIQFFLSFTDTAHAGSAYYASVKNSVTGIGIQQFDNRGRFGLGRDGRLSGYSNMNDMRMWSSNLANAAAPKGSFFAVMSQELSHRWLMHMKFKGDMGLASDDLIGRQDAHWSALVNAYGSCQDGVGYNDNHDGTFTVTGVMDAGWAPLDQYGMGIIGPSEVEPFFYLKDARLNDLRLNKTSQRQLFRSAKVSATKVDVTMDQVLGAMGPRNPPKGTETPYYRAAFVLVTAPGQAQSDWQPYLDALKQVQQSFPGTWKAWTGGHGAICTRVSERCPEPVIGLQSAKVLDGHENLLAPGKPFELAVAIRNDGTGTSHNVSVQVAPVGNGVQVMSGPIVVPEIAEQTAVDLPSRFSLQIASDAECGPPVSVEITSTTEEGPSFTKPFEIPVGTKTLVFDPLNDAGDWTVNPDNSDTAMRGMWDLGRPQFGSALGIVTQLGDDHTPGDVHKSFNTGSTMGSLFNSNAVKGGKTTLQSPIYKLGAGRDPSLVFYVWHVALDFTTQGGPSVAPDAELVVQGSSDGGKTWAELAKIDESTKAWTRKSFRIRDKLKLTDQMRFRFAISNATPTATVKAGIDDVAVIDFLPGCKGVSDPMPQGPKGNRGGCRCVRPSDQGGSGVAFGSALFALVLCGSWCMRKRSVRSRPDPRARRLREARALLRRDAR